MQSVLMMTVGFKWFGTVFAKFGSVVGFYEAAFTVEVLVAIAALNRRVQSADDAPGIFVVIVVGVDGRCRWPLLFLLLSLLTISLFFFRRIFQLRFLDNLEYSQMNKRNSAVHILKFATSVKIISRSIRKSTSALTLSAISLASLSDPSSETSSRFQRAVANSLPISSSFIDS